MVIRNLLYHLGIYIRILACPGINPPTEGALHRPPSQQALSEC